jgi:hypothetical protein
MYDCILGYVYNCYHVGCLSSTPKTPAQGCFSPFRESLVFCVILHASPRETPINKAQQEKRHFYSCHSNNAINLQDHEIDSEDGCSVVTPMTDLARIPLGPF